MLFFKHRSPKLAPPLVGLIQAVGICAYVLLLSGLAFYTGSHGAPDPGPVFAMAGILFVFCFSAALCGTLFLGYPLYVFLVEKRPKDAFLMPVWTVVWMIIPALCMTIYVFLFTTPGMAPF